MTRLAWAYIGFIMLAGVALSVDAFLLYDPNKTQWIVFLILTGLASVTQVYNTEAPNHQMYHPSLMFYFAGVLLLQPAEFVLLVAIPHLVEWRKERLVKSENLYCWYIQPFNFGMHIILGLTAGRVFLFIQPEAMDLVSPRALVGATLAALAYTLFNHLIVGQVLVLARGVPWKESGILEFDSLATDFTLLAKGYAAALLMSLNAWLILPALAPLYLVQRALAVPRLKRQANTDSKTGLWNSEYFVKALETELNRAGRFERPLTVVMADIDFLRNINNAYGHLAGDAVLKESAEILKGFFRDYDVVARFGGEEFAVLMPETTPQEAYPRIEAVRAAVEQAEFESPITRDRIKATMSFGLAGIGAAAEGVNEIIHCADVAVYEAKIEGRNRTKIYTPEIAYALGIRDRSAVGSPQCSIISDQYDRVVGSGR